MVSRTVWPLFRNPALTYTHNWPWVHTAFAAARPIATYSSEWMCPRAFRYRRGYENFTWLASHLAGREWIRQKFNSSTTHPEPWKIGCLCYRYCTLITLGRNLVTFSNDQLKSISTSKWPWSSKPPWLKSDNRVQGPSGVSQMVQWSGSLFHNVCLCSSTYTLVLRNPLQLTDLSGSTICIHENHIRVCICCSPRYETDQTCLQTTCYQRVVVVVHSSCIIWNHKAGSSWWYISHSCYRMLLWGWEERWNDRSIVFAF